MNKSFGIILIYILIPSNLLAQSDNRNDKYIKAAYRTAIPVVSEIKSFEFRLNKLIPLDSSEVLVATFWQENYSSMLQNLGPFTKRKSLGMFDMGRIYDSLIVNKITNAGLKFKLLPQLDVEKIMPLHLPQSFPSKSILPLIKQSFIKHGNDYLILITPAKYINHNFLGNISYEGFGVYRFPELTYVYAGHVTTIYYYNSDKRKVEIVGHKTQLSADVSDVSFFDKPKSYSIETKKIIKVELTERMQVNVQQLLLHLGL